MLRGNSIKEGPNIRPRDGLGFGDKVSGRILQSACPTFDVSFAITMRMTSEGAGVIFVGRFGDVIVEQVNGWKNVGERKVRKEWRRLFKI